MDINDKKIYIYIMLNLEKRLEIHVILYIKTGSFFIVVNGIRNYAMHRGNQNDVDRCNLNLHNGNCGYSEINGKLT